MGKEKKTFIVCLTGLCVTHSEHFITLCVCHDFLFLIFYNCLWFDHVICITRSSIILQEARF